MSIMDAIRKNLPHLPVSDTDKWDERRWWASLDDSAIVVSSEASLLGASSTQAARLNESEIVNRLQKGLPVYAQVDGHYSTLVGGEWVSRKTYLRVSGYDLQGGIYLGGSRPTDYFMA